MDIALSIFLFAILCIRLLPEIVFMKFVLFGFSRMFCRKGLHSFYMLEEHERWRGKKIGRNISLLFSREAKFFFNSEGEEFESRQYIQR